jgi:hypothetical protein
LIKYEIRVAFLFLINAFPRLMPEVNSKKTELTEVLPDRLKEFTTRRKGFAWGVG